MSRPQRALITGISGFVGSHLADYLLAETDWEVYGLIRWRSPLDNIEHLLSRANAGDRIHLVYGDLRDDTSLRAAVRESRPDYVFHLAAQSYPVASFTAPCDTLETNVQGTVRLLEALKNISPRPWIHVCSSSEVYGRVTKNVPLDENSPFHPASPYAISKVGTDLVGRHYAEAYGMNIIVTRMFTHTGPRRGDVFMESTFAKQIAMCEAGLTNVVRVGNLKSLRTISDVRDAVRAYHWALTINPQSGQVYNIGGMHSCTAHDVLNTLIGISTAKNVGVETDPSRLRPIDADLQIPNTHKFRTHTGWSPKIHYKETMLDLLDYWRERIKTRRHLIR